MCTGSKPIRISHIWKYAMKIRNIYNELFNYFLALENELTCSLHIALECLKSNCQFMFKVKINNKTKQQNKIKRQIGDILRES